MNTPNQTATLIAVAFLRSKQLRARLSNKSLQRLAGSPFTGGAYLVQVMQDIAVFGIVMAEIETGGFGLLYTRALCGAKSMPASNFLTEEEIESPNLAQLHSELVNNLPDLTGE
jgi:hypothetical protein